jgi:CRISPR-associated protein Cmr6
MRQLLRPLGVPDNLNFGLAYDIFAPVKDEPDHEKRRDMWLSDCAKITIPTDYALFFRAWHKSFTDEGGVSWTREARLDSRLLVGHGNPSGAEVGLTVHRTWGVPMIPGSALKGLAAGYADAVYGGETAEGEGREKWRGVVRDGRRIVRAPGEYHAALFGAPAVDEREGEERQGLVIFHDALYVPDSARGNKPFERDVLTVHQKEYYRSEGSGEQWPSDWDSPNPVAFLTVRPEVRLLLALSGPAGWRSLAERLLTEALENWGAGGKTSLAYGRMRLV